MRRLRLTLGKLGVNVLMKIVALIGMAMLVGSCAAPVTKEGAEIFISPANSAHLHKCKMLGQVRVKANTMKVWHADEAVQEIKNRLRDRTAAEYPGADTVSYPDLSSGVWFNPEIMGIAYKCFPG